ncbi:MAG TPA: hypothetical protein VFM55_22410 [Micromonosporaceae bacterium]|nr:hypothetical protein [Micromonosporaceae bacterium]
MGGLLAQVRARSAGLSGPSGLVLAGLLAAFLAARVYIAAGGEVFTSYDTFTYAYRGDPSVDRGPLLSFTGHSPRLWGVPLLYAVLPTDGLRALAQWAIATLAWAVLAWAVWSALRTSPARELAAGAILLLGLMPAVASWDFAILSESLSISLAVLTLALLLRWAATGSRTVLAGLVATAVWWTFTRPEIRLPVAALTAVLLAYAVRDRVRRRAAVAAAVVLVGAIAWVTAVTPVQSDSFQRWGATGLPQKEEVLVYRLRLVVLPDAQMKAVYQSQLGMPGCPGAEQVAAGSEWAIAQFAEEYRRCPQLRAWGQREGAGSGFRFALTEPGEYARYVRAVAPRTLAGTAYARTPAVVPRAVQEVAFPARERAAPLVLGGLVAAGLAALAAGAWRRRRLLLLTAAGVGAVAAVAPLVELMYTAGEYGRFGIQEAVLLRLAGLLLAAVAVDVLTERLAGDRSRPVGATTAAGSAVGPGVAAPESVAAPREPEAAGQRLRRRDWIPTHAPHDPRTDQEEPAHGRRDPS